MQIESLVQPFQDAGVPFEFEVEGNGDQEVVLDLPEQFLVRHLLVP